MTKRKNKPLMGLFTDSKTRMGEAAVVMTAVFFIGLYTSTIIPNYLNNLYL